MSGLIRLSLTLNVLVLLPVVHGLMFRAPWAEEVYGPESPARAILLAVYAAILVISALAWVWPRPEAVATLLLLQVMYKLLSAATVGSARHPVVLSNLLIAAVHCVTLASIIRALRTR